MITAKKERLNFYKLCHLVESLNEEQIEKIAQVVMEEMPVDQEPSPYDNLGGEYGKGLTDMDGAPLFDAPTSPEVQTLEQYKVKPDQEFETEDVERTERVKPSPAPTPENAPVDQAEQALFPTRTFDGEMVPEKKFKTWVISNVHEYIDSMVEDLKMRGAGDDPKDLAEYITTKGWSRFVNSNNPVKVFMAPNNRNKYVEYAREFQKQTGKTIRDIYMGYARKALKGAA